MKIRKPRLAILLLTILAAVGGFMLYNRFFYERANPSMDQYPVRGVDLSAHNGIVDYPQLPRQGIEFAYVKATEGTDFIDRRFKANVEGLTREGVHVGAYHFFRFDTDGEMQALNFIRAMRGRPLTLRPAIDVEEWGNTSGQTTAQIMRQLRAMIIRLRTEGYNPVIYTNKDGYQRFIKGKLDEYDLWLCSFTDPPLDHPRPIHLWQYSHRGSIDGINGAVDLNATTTIDPLRHSGTKDPGE